MNNRQVLYLHDRFTSLDFSHASDKYRRGSDTELASELGKHLANDWLFERIFSMMGLRPGDSFESYLKAYSRWSDKSLGDRIECE